MTRDPVRGMNLTGGRPPWKMLAGWLCGGLSGMAAFPIPALAQERPWEWGGHPMWGMWGAWGLGMMLVMLTF